VSRRWSATEVSEYDARPRSAGGFVTVMSKPLERDVLSAVMQILGAHPKVAWVRRVNSGMAMLPGRGGRPQPVRFGFPGCSDVMGQLKDGRLLCVEVKRPGGQPTELQVEFLSLVQRHHGIAFVARGVTDVLKALEAV
jgi:hypothetical protein